MSGVWDEVGEDRDGTVVLGMGWEAVELGEWGWSEVM